MLAEAEFLAVSNLLSLRRPCVGTGLISEICMKTWHTSIHVQHYSNIYSILHADNMYSMCGTPRKGHRKPFASPCLSTRERDLIEVEVRGMKTLMSN
jgi:hypothetical protein